MDLHYILPPTPAETLNTAAESARLLRALAGLNATRRRPASVTVPSADLMRSTLSAVIETALSGSPETRRVGHAATGLVRDSDVFPVVERFLRRHPEALRNVVWAFAQRDYANRVTRTVIESFIVAMPGALAGRGAALAATRGEGWVGAHLAVAALTPATVPTQFLFACGLIYQLSDDAINFLIEILHLVNRPEEVLLDALQALHGLLEMAFLPDQQGIDRARQLGRRLAEAFSGSLEEALFPSPFGRLGNVFYSPLSQDLIRAAARVPGGESAERAASLVMVPFSLGAFLGPVLLDVLMAILGLVVPGLEEMLLARAGRYLRRVIGIADELVEAAELVRELERVTPDLHDARALGRDARLADGAANGVPDSVVGSAERGTRQVPEGAPPEPAHTPEPAIDRRQAEADTRAARDEQRHDQPDERTRAHRGLELAMEKLRDRYGVDVGDPYTRERLERIFTRLRGINAGSGSDALVMQARADAGELRTLIRYSRQGPRGGSDVVRLRFVPESNSARTPDIAILRHGSNGDELVDYVEVRTRTQARAGERVRFREGQRSRQPLSVSRDYVERKIRRGQITRDRPGSVVFHSPFSEVGGELAEWQRVFDDLARSGMPDGVRRVEFTGAGDEILVFEPPSWRGRLEHER